MAQTHTRICPLCEATCGLEITTDGDQVVRIRGDREDVYSKGFICPKGSTLKQLHEDPDRLRKPLVKRDGAFVEVGWDEAYAEIEARLLPLLAEHGRDALAVVLGNPSAHHLATVLFNPLLLRAAGTKQIYSASTVDQMPAHVASGLVLGDAGVFLLPDLDRTDHLLMLGANPHASNGSLLTAPDMPGRLAAIRERGGQVVVVDPRRTETAAAASEHLFIRPASDALWLAALVNVLFAEDLVAIGRLEPHVSGVEQVRDLVAPFTPEAVADATGIDAATTRRHARALAGAERAAVYGRMGAHTTPFGTLAAWLVACLNVLTGNFDEPGGVMTSSPAFTRIDDGTPGGRGFQLGRWSNPLTGAPEVRGEYPAAHLAAAMEDDGPHRVRAVLTHAANPVRSFPNSERLDAAFAGLDFMVAIDIYVNETSRHADVILPPPSVLERPHYDLAFEASQIRAVTRYSPAVFPNAGLTDEDVLARLTLVLQGKGATADPALVYDAFLGGAADREVADARSPIHGRDREEILGMLQGDTCGERWVDLRLRTGRFGDGFGATPDGLSLAALVANPHGLDFGPMVSRYPNRLKTASGTIELAPAPVVADVPRLRALLDGAADGDLLLIGRRHVRSNNSWMHNVNVLLKGKDRCTLLVHPADADRLGLADGGTAKVSSRVGTVLAPVELTDDMMPGVVSLPHGWGHDHPDLRLSVAAGRPGVNSNALTDDGPLDALSGNAQLNGIPVTVTAG